MSNADTKHVKVSKELHDAMHEEKEVSGTTLTALAEIAIKKEIEGRKRQRKEREGRDRTE